jgi:hypothetical protein
VWDWRQKSDQKSIHVLTGISPNTLRTCLKNNRLRAFKTRKPQAFLFGSSRTTPGYVPATIYSKLHKEQQSKISGDEHCSRCSLEIGLIHCACDGIMDERTALATVTAREWFWLLATALVTPVANRKGKSTPSVLTRAEHRENWAGKTEARCTWTGEILACGHCTHARIEEPSNKKKSSLPKPKPCHGWWSNPW